MRLASFEAAENDKAIGDENDCENQDAGAYLTTPQNFGQFSNSQPTRSYLDLEFCNMPIMEIPITCSLTEAQLAEHRLTVLDSVRDAVVKTTRLPDGYAYEFSKSPIILERVQQLVTLERQCCGFLTFEVLHSNDSIRLKITGPEKAIPIIADLFRGGDTR
jgi:hypothetical protein